MKDNFDELKNSFSKSNKDLLRAGKFFNTPSDSSLRKNKITDEVISGSRSVDCLTSLPTNLDEMNKHLTQTTQALENQLHLTKMQIESSSKESRFSKIISIISLIIAVLSLAVAIISLYLLL